MLGLELNRVSKRGPWPLIGYNKVWHRPSKLEANMPDFVVGTKSASGLTPLGSRTSAGRLLTKFRSCIYHIDLNLTNVLFYINTEYLEKKLHVKTDCRSEMNRWLNTVSMCGDLETTKASDAPLMLKPPDEMEDKW